MENKIAISVPRLGGIDSKSIHNILKNISKSDEYNIRSSVNNNDEGIAKSTIGNSSTIEVWNGNSHVIFTDEDTVTSELRLLVFLPYPAAY